MLPRATTTPMMAKDSMLEWLKSQIVRRKPYFRDLLDHMLRVESAITGIRDILISVFEARHLLEQQRQGAITR